jgi:hypothetical protein
MVYKWPDVFDPFTQPFSTAYIAATIPIPIPIPIPQTITGCLHRKSTHFLIKLQMVTMYN